MAGSLQCYAGQSSMMPMNGALGLDDHVSRARRSSPRRAPAPSSRARTARSRSTSRSRRSSLDPGVAPFSSKLYSVTASTMTLPQPANTVSSRGGIGGVPFNLIDVVRGYDA